LDDQAESLSSQITDEKEIFLSLKTEFGQLLTQLFQVDSENKKIKKINEEVSGQIEN